MIRQKRTIFSLFILAAFVVVLSSLSVFKVRADGTCTANDDNTTASCMQTNCQNAQAHGYTGACDPSAKGGFYDLVQSCRGRDGNGGGFGGNQFVSESETWNCSNAIASCYENTVGSAKDACQNDTVLAMATCNIDASRWPGYTASSTCDGNKGDGNHDADTWNSQQGIINGANKKTEGQDYNANDNAKKEIKDSFLEDSGGICVAQRAQYDENKCKQGLSDAFDQCLKDQNAFGNNNAYDADKMQECMKKVQYDAAKTQDACAKIGGQFDSKANKCNSPPPLPPEPDQCDVKYPVPAAGDPNWNHAADLNAACKNGRNGHDCEQLYSKDSAYSTRSELADACSAGQDEKDGLAGGPGSGYKANTGQCGEARVNILTCGDKGGNEALQNLLKIAVIALSMVVGAAALAGLAYSALQYARGSDNQNVISEAKDRIRNIIIGLFLFGFIIVIINWLVPGGILQ